VYPQKRNGKYPKQRMMKQQIRYPLLTWKKPRRSDICTELNIEKYQLPKDGNVGHSYPSSTHDYVFWGVALSIYGTDEVEPEQFLNIAPR
jgi:hypothetical protein